MPISSGIGGPIRELLPMSASGDYMNPIKPIKLESLTKEPITEACIDLYTDVDSMLETAILMDGLDSYLSVDVVTLKKLPHINYLIDNLGSFLLQSNPSHCSASIKSMFNMKSSTNIIDDLIFGRCNLHEASEMILS